MNEAAPLFLPVSSALGAGFFFLLELVLSLVLVSITAMSSVSLHRLAADVPGRLAFLADLKDAASPHRLALQLAKQVSLIAACVLLGVTVHALQWPVPWILGPAGGLLLGVLLIEGVLARILALRDPKGAVRFFARMIRSCYHLLYPIVVPLSRVLSRTHARRTDRNAEENGENPDEHVVALIAAGEREGILEAAEGEMMRSIADLDETLVREVMTPRPDIVFLSADDSVSAARRTLIEGGHSRIPVYDGTSDNIVGVLHARDLFSAWEAGADDRPITGYLRPAVFVPETITLAELLAEMRTKTQIAMVVDEYGGIAGLVTLEDILEEIVGDIRDEHDEQQREFVRETDGSWKVLGSAPIKEFENLFAVDIGERDFDTVAGMVVSSLGHVPRKGERLELHGMRFEIVKSDNKRVYQIRIRPTVPTDAAEASS